MLLFPSSAVSLFFKNILSRKTKLVKPFTSPSVDSRKIVDKQKSLFTEFLVVRWHPGRKKSFSTGGIVPEIEFRPSLRKRERTWCKIPARSGSSCRWWTDPITRRGGGSFLECARRRRGSGKGRWFYLEILSFLSPVFTFPLLFCMSTLFLFFFATKRRR